MPENKSLGFKELVAIALGGVIAFFAAYSYVKLGVYYKDFEQSSMMNIIIVASVTFVGYEGFQLVINAVNEMDNPEKNIPKAIYTAVILVAVIYFIIALGAVMAIPVEDLIKNEEYALVSGAEDIMGHWGRNLVIIGAVLATSSAISGTMFGSSRQMARIADDGYLPNILSKRKEHIPTFAIIAMAATATLLILEGGLRLILFYEFKTQPDQLFFIAGLYVVLSIGAWSYAKVQKVV